MWLLCLYLAQFVAGHTHMHTKWQIRLQSSKPISTDGEWNESVIWLAKRGSGGLFNLFYQEAPLRLELVYLRTRLIRQTSGEICLTSFWVEEMFPY